MKHIRQAGRPELLSSIRDSPPEDFAIRAVESLQREQVTVKVIAPLEKLGMIAERIFLYTVCADLDGMNQAPGTYKPASDVSMKSQANSHSSSVSFISVRHAWTCLIKAATMARNRASSILE